MYANVTKSKHKLNRKNKISLIFIINWNYDFFNIKDGFSFGPNQNELSILENSLVSESGRVYEFLIQTDYHESKPFQLIRVTVESQTIVPILSLE
jgi:hypothetical protein